MCRGETPLSWFDGIDEQLPAEDRVARAADQAETDAMLRAAYAADVSLEQRVLAALRSRAAKRRRLGLLAVAAALIGVTLFGWPAAEVALAPDCQLERFDAQVRVLGPRTIRLDRGEIMLAVGTDKAVVVITPVGRIATRAASRVMVGAYPKIYGDTPKMTTLRTLVFTGAILLTTPHGKIAGSGGDLLAGEPNKPPQAVARRHVGLALDLHRALVREAPKANLVTAPHTVAAALALAYQGARGQTARALARLLRVDHAPGRLQWEAARLSAAMGSLSSSLNRPGLAGHARVRTAAAVWADRRLPIRDGLAGDLAGQRAGLFRIDLSDWQGSRRTINDWIARQTGNTIPRLLPEEATREAGLVLTSAMHFKGEWARFFDKSQTKLRSWTRLDGTRTQAMMMSHLTAKQWACRMFGADGEAIEWQSKPASHPRAFRAIELPYKGERYSLLCLMTTGHDTLGGLEAWLNPSRLQGIIGQLELRECELVLPRLVLRTSADLHAALRSLGATSAFGPDADFGGFTTAKARLPLLGVHHGAMLRIDERGTEAGGATAIPTASEIPRSFVADRPFLFALRDRKTGGILFLGRVVDPTTQ